MILVWIWMSFYVNLLLAELFGWQWSNLYAAWNTYVNIYYFWYFIFLKSTVVVVKLSFMVAKKLVSTFSDLWAVTRIINTFSTFQLFLLDCMTDLVIFIPDVARREHGYSCWVARWSTSCFHKFTIGIAVLFLSWWWGSHSKCNDEDDDKFNFDTSFFTLINPLTPKMLVERVLVMLVKFGGVEPYLLGKSGLARDRRVSMVYQRLTA